MKTKIALLAGLLCLAGLTNANACSPYHGPCRVGPAWTHCGPIARRALPYAPRGYAGRSFYRGFRAAPVNQFSRR